MICRIGKVMGKQTIAEFVENDATIEASREIGVDYAQGYGVGRPEPFEIASPAIAGQPNLRPSSSGTSAESAWRGAKNQHCGRMTDKAQNASAQEPAKAGALIVPVSPFQQNYTSSWNEATKHGVVIDPGGD
ncbi:hypothetical protein OY671_012249, partial [Metschnikowia pulcherrima]